MGEKTMDMTSYWMVLTVRYDILTKAQIAIWAVFLLAMAIIRRGIK